VPHEPEARIGRGAVAEVDEVDGLREKRMGGVEAGSMSYATIAS